MARDHGDPMIHGAAFCSASADLLAPPLSRNHESWVFELRNREWLWCGNERDYNELGKEVLQKLGDERSGFFEIVDKESRHSINVLREAAFKARDAPLERFSNEELAALFEEVYETWRQMNKWGQIVNLSDFEHFMLSNKINAFLETRVKQSGSAAGIAEAVSVLLAPAEKSPFALQDEAFFEVLAKIQGDAQANDLFQKNPAGVIAKRIEEFPEIDRALHAHAREYDWMQYHYSGPIVLDEAFFIEALASETRQRVNGKERLREFAEKTKALREKQGALEKALGLNAEEKRWIQIARSFMLLKAWRKDAAFQASRNTQPLLTEIARRFGVSFKQALYLMPNEITRGLRGGSLAASGAAKALLDERVRHCFGLFTRAETRFITGAEAEEFSKRVTEEKMPANAASVRELRGMPASPGSARGTVKIIVTAADMKKMRDGDILVSPATNPNLVPAMKKASAIVTNEGGVTCHAAIVSRELGVPCVIGTRIATRVLRDGDEVEVDASRGIVKLIKRP